MEERKGILNVGFIGCGNFGGQIANAAVEEGFPSIAVNASKRDFATLSEDVVPFLVGDGKGTGKSREVAKEFFLNHINIVKDEVITKFIDNNDVIIIGGSAGGGYGSGSVPSLTQVLMEVYPDKCFRVVTTFPSIAETYEAQNHAEQFMSDILDLNIPYIVYDNDNFKNVEATEMNKLIIRKVVEDMKILRGDYILETTTGGIDERDLLTLNSTPGRTVCALLDNFEESMIENDSIVTTLKQAMVKSANAAIVDDKVIAASGIMYNLTSDLKKYGANIATDLQDTFGAHIGDFRNEVVDEEAGAFIACVISGLTAPTTRIDKIITRRMSIEKEINDRKAASTKLNTVETGKLSLGAKSFGSAPKANVDDILKKFTANK